MLAVLLSACSSKPVDKTAGWSPNRIQAEAREVEIIQIAAEAAGLRRHMHIVAVEIEKRMSIAAAADVHDLAD